MTGKNTKPPAVAIAKEEAGETEPRIVERQGVRARLVAVPAGVLEESESRIKDPPVPMWHNPDKDREEENPNDPAYLRALQENELARGKAAMEAVCLWGVELLNGLPEDDAWIGKLKFAERRGHLDLSWVDWNDPIELEFVFKRYAFVTVDDLTYCGMLSRLGEERMQAAEKFFRSNS